MTTVLEHANLSAENERLVPYSVSQLRLLGDQVRFCQKCRRPWGTAGGCCWIGDCCSGRVLADGRSPGVVAAEVAAVLAVQGCPHPGGPRSYREWYDAYLRGYYLRVSCRKWSCRHSIYGPRSVLVTL